MSKTTGIIFGLIGLAIVIFLALWLTDVDVEDAGELPSIENVEGEAGALPEVEVRGGEMPSVDVEGEGGEVPEVDVDTADVDVETGTETVEVPTVEVDMEPADAEGDMKEAADEVYPGEGDDEAEAELEDEPNG